MAPTQTSRKRASAKRADAKRAAAKKTAVPANHFARAEKASEKTGKAYRTEVRESQAELAAEIRGSSRSQGSARSHASSRSNGSSGSSRARRSATPEFAADTRFGITGTYPGRTRADLANYLSSLGVELTSGQAFDVLIDADGGRQTVKREVALDRNLPIISVAEFDHWLDAHSGAAPTSARSRSAREPAAKKTRARSASNASAGSAKQRSTNAAYAEGEAEGLPRTKAQLIPLLHQLQLEHGTYVHGSAQEWRAEWSYDELRDLYDRVANRSGRKAASKRQAVKKSPSKRGSAKKASPKRTSAAKKSTRQRVTAIPAPADLAAGVNWDVLTR